MSICSEPEVEQLPDGARRAPVNEVPHETQAATRREAETPVVVSPPRILLAEDDTEMRVLLAGQLRRAGYEVVECRNGEGLVQELASTFLPSAHSHDFDLVISDIRMPGFSGLEVLDGLHDRPEFPPMILITAFGDPETHARARRLGAVATLDKPFRLPDLFALVRGAVRRPRHDTGSRGARRRSPRSAPRDARTGNDKENER